MAGGIVFQSRLSRVSEGAGRRLQKEGTAAANRYLPVALGSRSTAQVDKRQDCLDPGETDSQEVLE